MPDLPIMLRVEGRRCVVVGGGAVALRRAQALLEAGAVVVVIAPEVDPALERLPVTVERRAYRRGDLQGALLVVVATDDAAVNNAVSDEARAVGALVNRADDPAEGDLSIPAHARHGPVTIAVHTSGVSAAAAAAIRRQLSESLDRDWPRLLEAVAPYRSRIQRQFAEARQRRELLAMLTNAEAMAVLKQHGLAALEHHCEDLLQTPATPHESA